LLNEGVDDKAILVTGNTVIDALQYAVKKLDSDSILSREVAKNFDFLNLNMRLILVTGHRRESFGEGFESICLALKAISEAHDDVEIIYPVHLNPNVREPVNRILSNIPRIHLVEPQEYVSFVYLMNRSHLIITDSGGVQEEAPSLGKPVLVLRDTTERPEAIEAGTVKLVGTNTKNIIAEVSGLLNCISAYELMSGSHNPYGDGKAAIRIVMSLH
jgi:UDP-N-acetylglucosamine 2-epimerase (non-hydrolysing)